MARKKPSGIYQRLLHELSLYNKGLPIREQLPLPARYKLLSESIYPKFAHFRPYQFRVLVARKKIKSAVKKSLALKGGGGAQIYQRLFHELSEYNKTLSEEKQLSVKDRYQLLSESIYPKYKHVKMHQFRVTKARKSINYYFQKLLKKRGGDVFGIPENTYQNILYWELDDYLSKDKHGKLSHGFNVKVSAGSEHGETDIFNTSEYNYYELGLDDITNSINDAQRAKSNKKAANYPFYTGKVQLIPGRSQNSDAANYFLQLILVEDGVLAEDVQDIEKPVRKGKRAKKKEKETKKLIRESERAILVEKSRAKRIRNGVEKEIQETALIMSKKYIENKETYKKRVKQSELERIKRYFKNGAISEYQYEALVKRIEQAYK